MRRKEPLPSPPWYFRGAKFLKRKGRWGGNYAIEALQWLGFLDCTVRYRLSDTVTIDVPLDRRPNQWDEIDLANYERPLIETIAQAAEGLPGPLTLLDCGADIGVFSALLAARLHNLEKVIAFEPNPAVWQILSTNISRLPLAGEVRPSAVAASAGQGALCSPDRDRSEHARFFSPLAGGPIRAEAIDDLAIVARELVLKIDVEGGELDVLRGARGTLAAARHFIVAFEAHGGVWRRTGVDPVEGLRLLNDVRPCVATVCEEPSKAVATERPFFEQFDPGRVYNLVCVSAPMPVA